MRKDRDRGPAFNGTEMIKWPLAHGASIDARDCSDARAIDLAKAMGAADAVALLSL